MGGGAGRPADVSAAAVGQAGHGALGGAVGQGAVPGGRPGAPGERAGSGAPRGAGGRAQRAGRRAGPRRGAWGKRCAGSLRGRAEGWLVCWQHWELPGFALFWLVAEETSADVVAWFEALREAFRKTCFVCMCALVTLCLPPGMS